MISGS